MTAPVASLSARSVAVVLVLVASTRSSRLAVSYWARVTRTVSVFDGGGGGGGGPAVGLTVMSPDRDWPPPGTATVIVAICWAVTAVVVIGKVAVVAPAGTTTAAGTDATAAFELVRS